MRLVTLALALAVGAALPPPAAAQVSTPPLAPGEVLVQTGAIGHLVSAPDRAMLRLSVFAHGPDAEGARRAARAKVARTHAALAAAGIAPTDIQSGEVSLGSMYPELSSRLLLVTTADSRISRNEAGPPTAMATLTVTIRDLGGLQALRDTLAALDVISAAPEYYLADDDSARNAARAQAMQKARAEAETYAAGVNMRVVRIVRITERIGLDGLGLLVTEMPAVSRLFSRMWRSSPDVDTMVAVGVDFALAPR